MSRKSRKYTDDRRTFLKKLAVAGGATAAVAMAGRAAFAAPETDASNEAKPQGYRETAHITTYYRTARL
ncbi:MAG: formate dehydrogenase [Gammaproteobacteria bacterium]|nr:formate dehydrogenase [Gammaproteobacteria bacterium]